MQAIRAPCGFLSFDFTLCCEDPNVAPATTTTTQRPVTTTTTQRPIATTTTTQAPLQDPCGTNSANRIVGGTQSRQGDWPWAVVIGTKNPFSSRFQVCTW